MSWYDNNENWYKPNYTTHADPVQPDAQRQQAKLAGSRAARIVAIVMCTLLLLGGGTYAVLNSDRSGSGSDDDESLPKSYMTYFEDYYSAASNTPSSITRIFLPCASSMSALSAALPPKAGSTVS